MEITGFNAGVSSETQPLPRLVRAAREFEGQMMKELLKPLAKSKGLEWGDTETSGGGVMGEFAAEALGQAISQRGGFGIADKVVAQLSHSGSTRAVLGG